MPDDAEYAETAFDFLDTTRWHLADYVLRGERALRLVNAPHPLVATIGDADDSLTELARVVRIRADALAEQVRHTNGVVSRWLVAHRVAVANPCYLDSNALLDRYRRGDLDPVSVSEDPLYLLVCHLQDVLAAADEWDDPDARALHHVKAQLTLPLRMVRDEMALAVAHQAAAVELSRGLERLRAR